MVSRPARVALLALTTAFLIFYHSSILSTSSWKWESDEGTASLVPIVISQNPTSSGPILPPQVIAPPDNSGLTGATPQDSSGPSGFNEVKYEFQEDLAEYPQANFKVEKLKQYKAHNDHGPGQFAFATYLSTRNNSVHDPYFLSAQQIVYRLLWDPKSRSAFHPVVVFVAPFIPQEQRDILQAAGAIVRELELVPWDPPKGTDGTMFPFARWRDLFSKLNIWAQLDFSRIAFLDLDAFPVQSIDGIFDDSVAPRQRCKAELLPPEDKEHEAEICDYVWAGHGLWDGVNVGAIVLEPNAYMHRRLLRESRDTDKFDNKLAEQAFLNYAFAADGPFPPKMLGREWNGFYPKEHEEGQLRIVHEKLWIFGDNTQWTKDIFRNGWAELLALYQSPQFELIRANDGLVQQSSGSSW